jgi:tight adherence protein B
MTVIVVLVFAIGVFVLYDALTSDPRPARPRRRVVHDAVSSLLARAGMGSIRPAQLGGACALAAAMAAVLTALLVGSTVVMLVVLVAGGYLPLGVVRARGRSRRWAFRQCWPEAVELLAGSVRAGDTLPAAIAVVAERGPALLRPAFSSLATDHRVSGDLLGALDRLAEALGDSTADRVLATLAIAHRVGGRELGRVLRTLAAFLRDDAASRREIESRQSWTRVAARVSAAAPWVVLLLVGTRSSSVHAFDSVAGAFVIVGGAIATIVGYRLMVALGRLPEEPRLLRLESAR